MEVQRNSNGHIFWTDELIKFILDNKNNISEIQRQTGIRKATISKKLTELGITERSSGRPKIYTVDEHIFDIIDSNEKAYYLGLLASDGSLNQNSSLIRLSLEEYDKYLLEQFNNFVKSNRPIFQSAGSHVCEACINSFHMQEALKDKGIGYQKSYNLKAPNIDTKYGKAFVLGLFDGDGSITYSNSQNQDAYAFRLTGTKEILEYCLQFLYIYDNKYYLTLAHNCNTTYDLRVIGNYRVAQLFEHLYQDNFNKPMKRKYDRFLELKQKAPKRRNSFSKLS